MTKGYGYHYLFDTNVCLELDEIPPQGISICDVTLYELESIKTMRNYSADTKYKARRFARLLRDYGDYVNVLEAPNILGLTNDKKIIECALANECILVTNDVTMSLLADRIYKLEVENFEEDVDTYRGYKEIELNDFTSNNIPHMLLGEYLIVKCLNNNLYYICVDEDAQELEQLDTENFNFYSPLFNKVSPIDDYQILVFDSMDRHDITLLKGKAGSGKSLLSLAYLFQELNRGHIDQIVIFANTVATKDSAQLGYYPGSRTEKLLDSQIGNMLSTHLGSMVEVERLISDELLQILPMADIRGMDLSNKAYGLFITESQNTTVDLMKLCLQRVGDGCKVIIDGDYKAQVDKDSYVGNNNGMHRVSEVFRGTEIYGEVELRQIHRGRIAEIADNM